MRRRFQIEIEGGDGAALELSSADIVSAVRETLRIGTGVRVGCVELRSAEIRSPIRNAEPVIPTAQPAGDPRHCDTQKLLELIRLDPICEPYKPAKRPDFDPAGRHLLIMVLPMVNVEESRGILTHRVEVNAKVVGSMTPYRFMLELPGNRWDKLAPVK